MCYVTNIMNIFEHDNYRKIVQKWVYEQPKHGRGLYLKIAEYLGLDSSILSKILNGERELGIENAYLLADYMGLIPIEKEYFINLALLEKSSNHKFKKYVREKVDGIKKESQNISRRIQNEKKMDELEQSKFYSTWLYSAIWLKCSIGKGLSFNELLNEFSIQPETLTNIIEFLLQSGLLKSIDGKFQMGPTTVFVGKDSPMLIRHHMNWRMKSLERASALDKTDLMFTAPLTCSHKDFEKIKTKITQLIQEVSATAQASESETLVYFGVDCFTVKT